MRIFVTLFLSLFFASAANAALITVSSGQQTCVGSNATSTCGATTSFDLSITGLAAPVPGSSGGNFVIRAFGDFDSGSEWLRVTTELGQSFTFFNNSPNSDRGNQYSSVLSRTVNLGPLTTAAIADGTFTLSFLVSNAVNNLGSRVSWVEFDLTYDTAAVPEPGTLGLLTLGLMGLGLARQKRES